MQPATRAEKGMGFFIWIRRNTLKRPDSTKESTGKQGFSLGIPWYYLDFLGANARYG
jgi:hypothetical protein